MNKISSKFHSKPIEDLYQDYWSKYVRIPIFQCGSVGLIINCIIQITLSVIDKTRANTLIHSGILAYLILQLGMSLKWSHHKHYLTLLNLVLTTQIHLNFDDDLQNGILIHAQSNLLNIVILFASDFQMAILQLIYIATFHITIYGLENSHFRFDLIISTVASFILVALILFKLNYLCRDLFLKGLKDAHWQRTLTNVIQETFFLFTFNEETLQFQPQIYNISKKPLIASQYKFNDLKSFLKQYRLFGVTLEKYIFMRIQNKYNYTDPISQTNFKVLSTQSKHEITYSEFNIPEQTFLIVFSEDDEIRTLQREQAYQIKKSNQNFVKVIKRFNWMAQYGALKRNLSSLDKIAWLSHVMLCKSRFKQTLMSAINLEVQLEKAINMYRHTQSKYIVILQVDEEPTKYLINSKIETVELLIIELLNLIHGSVLQSDLVKLHLFRMGGSIQLGIHNLNVHTFKQCLTLEYSECAEQLGLHVQWNYNSKYTHQIIDLTIQFDSL